LSPTTPEKQRYLQVEDRTSRVVVNDWIGYIEVSEAELVFFNQLGYSRTVVPSKGLAFNDEYVPQWADKAVEWLVEIGFLEAGYY